MPGTSRKHGYVRWIVTFALALAFLFPLYWMVVTAVSPLSDLRSGDYGIIPHQVELSNFTRAWNKYPFDTWLGNSTVIALISVTLTVTINVICGYAFAKLRFPGRNVLFILILSTLMIPIQVLMVPQFEIVADFGWVNSNWGVIIPRAAEAFGIFFARQYFMGIPDELLEAARIDGARELAILRRIVLPLSKPLIAVLVIFTFMWRWNEFAWPLIVLNDSTSYTLPVGMLFLKGQYATDQTALMSMSIVAVLPMIAVFVFFQRYFVEGIARTGLK
jgi:multiple sugar transport system permease protein/alpha-1,4-digalacturonate transport system permease protein